MADVCHTATANGRDAPRLDRSDERRTIPSVGERVLADRPSLLRQLEDAAEAIAALMENYDELPEAYSSADAAWDSYDDISEACRKICRERQNLLPHV